MLQVKDLRVSIDGKEVLKGMNLEVKENELHVIMGPNGSGKSTFSKVIAGHPDYQIESGSVSYEVNFEDKDLLQMLPEERAREGIFLAFQYPVEVPGVSNFEFLRASFNSIVEHQGGESMDSFDFSEFLQNKVKLLNLDESFVQRQVNVDFSGGEKKRNEILQMAVLSPRLCILDETDSGLDIDSLRVVAQGINKLRTDKNSYILITHYHRILDYIKPDIVHILYDGKIIKTGDASLAQRVEQEGFEPLVREHELSKASS